MATQVQWRGGSTAEHSTFTGAAREVTVDTQKKTLVVHDGSTAGGEPLLREDGSNSALDLGSAATPALKFTGDTNTGIYSPGADQVAISTNGTGRLFVDASGNVGVGAASAGNLLHLSTAGTSYLQIQNTTAGNSVYLGNSSGNGILQVDGANSLNVSINGSERLRITSDGKLGLGTSSASQKLHIGGSAPGDSIIRQDATASGTNWEIGEREAGKYQWWEDDTDQVRMTLTSGGLLGIGTTAAVSLLSLDKGNVSNRGQWSDCALAVYNPTNVGSYSQIGFGYTPSQTYASAYLGFISTSQASSGKGDIVIGTRDVTTDSQPSEKLRLTSDGKLLVGTSSNLAPDGFASKLQVAATDYTASLVLRREGNDAGSPTLIFAKTRSGSLGGSTVVNNGDIVGNIAFYGADGTDVDSTAASIQAQVDGTPGANDMPGRLVFSTTADGASSPTERMRIHESGAVTIGKTNRSTTVQGVLLEPEGLAAFTRSANAPGTFNRQTDDGVIINLLGQDVVEGTISVSGTTVSYNGAHLSRWSQLVGIDPYDKNARPEILRGTVMSNLDEMCDWTCPISGDCQDNEQLNKTEISSVDGDPNVAGIFQSWDDDDDTWVNDFYLAMTGDFVIRIAAGTTVQRGDLLCSAGDGTAKPQSDDIVRSKTIAKVTSTTVSCTHPDGSYCVPCVLMAC